ncbi:LysR family transcriptional regulator [Salipiger mucosus]|uniref:Putative lysR-family transcriptional regulator n=1 Tax=Salipiger mucosus DSM 16094 TaxID=1123237 RepID=S9RR62_9RHOB|nr:LysR family transcriptional regulator [Salipiger mucosus]EPX76474.1 putative lysR-family transcriptional regulator [Salipiger mucosus DSM 16094]
MIRNLHPQWLRTFVTVCESGSMTRASEILNMTQGAVSQQIRKLEETLGAAVLDRGAQRVIPTGAGERLLGNARRMLSLNDAIMAEMTDLGQSGSATIGVPLDLISTDTLPRLLRSFALCYPNVELSLKCAATPVLKDDVAAGRVDVALLEEVSIDQLGEPLFSDRLVWVGAPNARVVDERPLKVSLISGACVFRPLVLKALDECGLDWRSVFESDNRDATVGMVRVDLAVTALLSSTLPGGLVELPASRGLPPLPEMNITLTLAPNPKAEARQLADHIRSAVGRPPPRNVALLAG